ncbi:MAG: UDP-N-acetylmuramate--L-alanine ligase [Treponema sp.]
MSKTVLPADLHGVRVHFVGIKGTGMAALVEIMCGAGAVISGSDVAERFYTDEILASLGIRPVPFSEVNIDDDIQFVVYSSAYSPATNPDLIAAARRKIPCMLYTEALGAYSERAYSAGICGVHGKTSTTGLAGTILKELPLPSQTLAGSVINSFGDGNRCTFTSADFSRSKNPYFVAETCEYQRHFMSFRPQKIVLTSVESDHQDFYPTFADIQQAFVDYICLLPDGGDLIYCADDAGAVETAYLASKKRGDIRLIPYGECANGDYRLEFKDVRNEENRFAIRLLGDLHVRVPGKHEVLDAAAACALACELLRADGKNPADFADSIKRGLANFSGGRRRSEIVGRAQNEAGQSVIVIDDYAHHPTAIKTTLAGFREFYSGRKIIVDFMPHTYSRTEALLDDFAAAFTDADIVILHKIYASARERAENARISGETLFAKVKECGKDVHYFEEILDAKDFALAELNKSGGENGFLFVTMGAGDNWKLGREVLNTLGAANKPDDA